MRLRAILFLFFLVSFCLHAQSAGVSFTVSMPDPRNHTFHVVMRSDGISREIQDFKLPAWTPGYYRILDYARNVSNFRVADDAGRALPWEKVTKNTWRVATGGAASVVITYDVFANTSFVAQNALSEQRAFITPPGLYMHPADRLKNPVTVTFQLPPSWTRIANGLDPVAGRPNTFSAPDFDTFYDCPTLLGTQELVQFELKGIPHRIVLENVPPGVNREKMTADLKRMVDAAVRLMGDIPYKHYTFLMMGQGNGGIEHTNSAAISFNGNSLMTEGGYRRWLSYVCHEYFHHYNVKRIRPLALGPFDYDRENLTNMLWVSEGLSVYYQDLVILRAALLTREQYLEKMGDSITRFENATGHQYQSATDSSWNTWGTSGVGNDRNTTISYYDNGAMLGAMLDLKIRHESRNRKSLDDVMRVLYRKYYQEKKRGFTDAEFRMECESAAGSALDEVFEYASTTRDVDYAKYFALGGLEVEIATEEATGAALGVNTQTRDGKLVVVTAANGLRAGDEILEAEGTRASPKSLNDLLIAKKPGDKLKLKISRAGATQEIEAILGLRTKRNFNIRPAANPNSLQTEILKDWLRPVQ
jgi:predicted metalloprotease with PDZ domain